DAAGPALGTRTEPLEGGAFVDVRLQHHERGLVERLAGLVGLHAGVGDGGLHDLADRFGRRLRGEPQHGDGLLGALTADEVHDAACLHGRDAHKSRLRLGFHVPALLLGSVRAPQRRRALRSSLSCPRKVRVGANSPSLWPTIASVTKTGTCLRPSCTAKVWPRKSGVMTDRRDQVLMTFLVPCSFWASTFFWRWSSTKGPVFRLRGMTLLSAPCRSGDGAR